eukprot:TRINITY_DN1782_c0_g1_i1.p1 TRINITY_DN1782_c0_g1~~TRINITY_DN1782_c0_g1_i1.p1  ORF type:complete len:434 (+),score=116.56 TRINITY_DN1782_c0_g1_i1:93-1394(+)
MALGDDWTLGDDGFVSLLEKLIGEAKYLQNNPPEFVPKEDRAIRHILDVLNPYSLEEGGPLSIRHISYVEGRGNLIVEYAGTDPEKIISFVGCHLDVVTANPDDWEFDPFSLSRDGDKLRGRGTTDCLGHVALLTMLFRKLAEEKPALKTTIVGVYIANEENSSALGVGVDQLVKEGLLNKLKNGPLFWVDTADKQPCIGTGGMAAWKLTAKGKLFHSGLPHKAINPIEFSIEALSEIQRRFYLDFPAAKEEEAYGFATSSTMKPTQISCPPGSINQIPGECTVAGDIRITPFYDVNKVITAIEGYVEDINMNLGSLATHGPFSKYELPDEGIKGKLELQFEEMRMQGVACNLDSPGFHALCQATKNVIGVAKPYSITGSLPLIRELKDEGFDVQTMGYGVMATYHARNEFCRLSDFKDGFLVIADIIRQFNS